MTSVIVTACRHFADIHMIEPMYMTLRVANLRFGSSVKGFGNSRTLMHDFLALSQKNGDSCCAGSGIVSCSSITPVYRECMRTAEHAALQRT